MEFAHVCVDWLRDYFRPTFAKAAERFSLHRNVHINHVVFQQQNIFERFVAKLAVWLEEIQRASIHKVRKLDEFFFAVKFQVNRRAFIVAVCDEDCWLGLVCDGSEKNWDGEIFFLKNFSFAHYFVFDFSFLVFSLLHALPEVEHQVVHQLKQSRTLFRSQEKNWIIFMQFPEIICVWIKWNTRSFGQFEF